MKQISIVLDADDADIIATILEAEADDLERRIMEMEGDPKGMTDARRTYTAMRAFITQIFGE